MIFSTERLLVRKLRATDFPPFHEMQSNPNVMQHIIGRAHTEAENETQLKGVIDAYAKPNNNFWVWAILRKEDSAMVGTCAIIKTEGEDEIGYRFLEKYWGNGYGLEITTGLINHALDTMKVPSLMAVVDKRNIASVKILERSKLKFIKEFVNEEGITDRLYRF